MHFFWGSFDLAVTCFSGHRAPRHPGGVRNLADEVVGFRSAPIRPEATFFSEELQEFILPYDAVRTADSPDAALLEFLQSTYEAAANAGHWDRAALECVLGAVGKQRPV